MPTTVNPLNSGVFNPEIWGKQVLEYREDYLVMASHVMRLDSEVKEKGDIIHLPRTTFTAARTKTAGSSITYDANTEGEFTLAITKQGYSAFVLEDISRIQSSYDLMRLKSKNVGYALGEQVEDDLMGLYTATAQTVGVVATSVSDRIAKTYLLRAKRFLDLAKAPKTERYIVLDAYGMEQMFALDDFIRYDATGEAAANATGKLPKGRIYGMEVLESAANVVAITNVARALIFHKEGIALAMQKDITFKNEYSVDELGEKVAGYQIYGYGAPRTDHIVVLQYGIA